MAEIRAVFFDVGETLVDETRMWESAAQWFGVRIDELVSRRTEALSSRRSHKEILQFLGFDGDLSQLDIMRVSQGRPSAFGLQDLYPDVRDAMALLKHHGYFVGIAGNQPASRSELIRDWDLPVDIVLLSEEIGFEKPSPAFFAVLSEACGERPENICYVGDRLDNDVLPARSMGMKGVLVRRGPWGTVHAGWPEVKHADAVIDSLSELPEVLDQLSMANEHRRTQGGGSWSRGLTAD